MRGKKELDDYLIRLGVQQAPPAEPVWVQPINIPFVRTVQPRTMAEELVGVQPMAPNTGIIFAERTTVDVQPRRLRANWSIELADDLQAMYGVNVESILGNMLVDEIANEGTGPVTLQQIEELYEE